jgi:hypothetical protein
MDPDIFIGKHRFQLEPPDLVFITNDGDISVEEATQIAGRVEAFAEGKDLVLILFNVERATNHISPEARKIVVNRIGKLPVGGIAMFGATFSQRVIATLMGKAMLLLYPSAPVVRFFPSEAAARAWLNERRRAPRAAS